MSRNGEALEELTRLEWLVIRGLFGLDGAGERTPSELQAAHPELTDQDIHAIEIRTLRKLRRLELNSLRQFREAV